MFVKMACAFLLVAGVQLVTLPASATNLKEVVSKFDKNKDGKVTGRDYSRMNKSERTRLSMFLLILGAKQNGTFDNYSSDRFVSSSIEFEKLMTAHYAKRSRLDQAVFEAYVEIYNSL